MLYPAELRARGWTLAGPCKKSGRSGGIRTPDILLPKQTRYQAALHSDKYMIRHVLRGAHDTHALLRSEEHTSELQSRGHLVCRLLLEKKKTKHIQTNSTNKN